MITEERFIEIMHGASVEDVRERADMLAMLATGEYVILCDVWTLWARIPAASVLDAETFIGYLRPRILEKWGAIIFEGDVWIPEELGWHDEDWDAE